MYTIKLRYQNAALKVRENHKTITQSFTLCAIFRCNTKVLTVWRLHMLGMVRWKCFVVLQAKFDGMAAGRETSSDRLFNSCLLDVMMWNFLSNTSCMFYFHFSTV